MLRGIPKLYLRGVVGQGGCVVVIRVWREDVFYEGCVVKSENFNCCVKKGCHSVYFLILGENIAIREVGVFKVGEDVVDNIMDLVVGLKDVGACRGRGEKVSDDRAQVCD